MKRDAFTLPLAFPGELIIDNFAGGGGTSTGLEAAFGRPVDIAINPALLFKDGKQAAHPLQVPRIPLSATAQVRMCGNSVSPPQAEALVRANFGHEVEIYGRAAA